MRAPLIGVLSLARVTVPVNVPVPTVKVTPLLATVATLTTTGPVVAPEGTGATIRLLLQLVGVARVPLNVRVLVPCAGPKFEPLMATAVPIGPEGGDRVVIEGAPKTTLTVVVLAALTRTEGLVVVTKLLDETDRSYKPALKFEIE
jgi:hypothetical protein